MKWIVFIIAVTCSVLASGREHIERRISLYEKDMPGLNKNGFDHLRDSQGFFWLATSDGALRFDGSKVETIFTEQDGPIHKTQINQFIEQNGHIWMASYNGLFRLDMATYTVDTFHHSNAIASLPNNNIRYLSRDNIGQLWVSSIDGLARYDETKKQFVSYYLPDIKGDIDFERAFRRVARDSSGRIWAATYRQGLQLITLSEDGLQPISSIKSYGAEIDAVLTGAQVMNVISLENGNIGVLASDRYLEFNPQQDLVEEVFIRYRHDQANKRASLYRLIADNKNRIWVSTFDGSLVRISSDRQKIHYYYSEKNKVGSDLHSETSYRLATDVDGSLALSYVNNNYQFWNPISDAIERIEIPGENISNSTVFVEPGHDENHIWLYFKQESNIYLFNTLNKTFKTYLTELPVQSLAAVNDQEVYIASRDQGVFRFDLNAETYKKVSQYSATTISYSKEYGLWVNTENRIANIKNENVESYQIPEASTLLGSEIFISNKWGIWLPAAGAIYHFDQNQKKFIRYEVDGLNLHNGSELIIVEDQIWVPGNGLVRLDLSEENGVAVVSNLKSYKQLGNEVILRVTERSGKLWFNNVTGDRIYRLSIESGVLEYFDVNEGFPRTTSTQILVKTQGGQLIMSEQGEPVVLSNPDALGKIQHGLSMVSSYEIINNQQQSSHHFLNTDKIDLSSDEQTIIFNFSDKKSYSSSLPPEEYRLLGRGERWLRTRGRTAVYSGLEPGDYRFEVRNIWTPSLVRSIGLSVSPPFWRSHVAVLLYVFSCLSVMALIFYLWWDKLQSQRKADDQIRLYAKSFEDAAEGFCVIDGRLRVIASNDSFKQLVGGDVSNLFKVKSNQTPTERYVDFWRILNKEKSWNGKLWCRSCSGREVPVRCKASLIDRHDSDEELFMLVVSDISDQVRYEEELERLANYDSLTGLPNRNLFRERLKLATSNSKYMTHSKFGLLYVDVDRFKTINDSLSHGHGDQLLKNLGLSMKSVLRSQDAIFRIGGDEFVAIIENINHVDMLGKLSRSLIRKAEMPISLEGRDVFVSLSIGVSVFPDDSSEPDDLLKCADAAMYAVKAKGGGNFTYYNASMNSKLLTALKLESDMRLAVRREEFTPYFQPKINMKTGRLVGVEALVRWRKPDLSLVLPGVFIEAAERTGAIIKIGLLVLSKTCEQLSIWSTGPYRNLTIAVNVSAHQLAQDDFLEQIQSLVSKYDFNPRRLEFEITESILMADKSDSILKLSVLRRMGHSISVDDFGTGYSSLSYLTELPIDVLKIDQSFVKNMLLDRKQLSVVKTIIELGENLELTVVAEGIETQAEHELLVSMGCHLGQGFWYAKPMTMSELDKSDLLLAIKETNNVPSSGLQKNQ